jgi:sugar-phosphatase
LGWSLALPDALLLLIALRNVHRAGTMAQKSLKNPAARQLLADTLGTRSRGRLAAASLPVPTVLIAAENVSEGKPNPEGYLAASAALGYDIVDCVVIEDSPAGIKAGRAAGARTVAVATSHDAAELSGADTVVPHLTCCAVQLRTDHVVLTAN